jgi:hypothetical protein
MVWLSEIAFAASSEVGGKVKIEECSRFGIGDEVKGEEKECDGKKEQD